MFFLYNAISFNATDIGPYYQAMINIIAEAARMLKAPQDIKLAINI